jgi:hypothetical protein
MEPPGNGYALDNRKCQSGIMRNATGHVYACNPTEGFLNFSSIVTHIAEFSYLLSLALGESDAGANKKPTHQEPVLIISGGKQQAAYTSSAPTHYRFEWAQQQGQCVWKRV